MDDNDCLCPLCCEELDISDRQFFPCKCGYQVCMWCWHRIRESESGLCPACRTPYGDDPHEFSAVDVEKVLKANKEKEAAAKRERDRQRQQQFGQADGNSTEIETLASLLGSGKKGQMEVPKDRNQLANMRVIRRNLVYAVGLPPSIANEEILKRPEYFGQYGKISKIVLNRSQTTGGGDLRRASASAYVTFAYKEDTLVCILAMDGFYMDGRSIRASYGTSKYCSAFIKNLRCNNPECTYLHEMGDVEDTFTKQEIQAGYVTSGRDVLARQQQIVEQALSAASGAAGSTPRRRTGGGGPSGTGKAASNPIFPAPSFDEPAKQAPPLVPPPSGASTRSASVNTAAAFPTIAAANAATTTPVPMPAPTVVSRSASVGAVPKASVNSAARQSVSAVSAASVVAGVRDNKPSALHTTLTPLTPLTRKNGSNKGTSKNDSNTATANTKLPNVKTGKIKNGNKAANSGSPVSADSSSQKPSGATRRAEGPSSIGGSVIAAPPPVVPAARNNGMATPLAGGDALSELGGEIFTGPLQTFGATPVIGNGTPIGSSNNKWNPSTLGGDRIDPSQEGLWGNGTNHGGPGLAPGQNGGQVGGNVIGGGNYQQGSGSSALASMLGINLPTGSGSLRESSDLWGEPIQPAQAPISALNGSSLPTRGVIGPGVVNQGNNSIGGLPIGGVPMGQPPIGNGGNSSDIALLQSLLPGVHITSGGSFGQNGGFGVPGPNQRPIHADMQQRGQWNAGLSSSSIGGAPIGAVGQGSQKQNQRQAPGNIW